MVVIVGTTGVGKTRLSVEIAKRFNGEIVNSDAMQMYCNLDIATAKVTEEEKEGIPHHLMSFLKPTEQYSVSKYQQAARDAIEDIAARGKLPVVVGGTMFYVQALLWNSLFDQDAAARPEADVRKRKIDKMSNDQSSSMEADLEINDSGEGRLLPESLTEKQKKELWEQLRKVDPLSANRIHPNNARRVFRSLEIFRKTGRPHSEIIAEHREQKDVQQLQYDAHIVWLHCTPRILDKRLDTRVENMRKAGLLGEVRKLWESVTSSAAQTQSENIVQQLSQQGVLKSIGFKEFCDYFALLQRGSDEGEASRVLEECIAKLKLSTRRYARKQVRWIRNRMLARGLRVHQYDTDDVEEWQRTVTEPAFAAVEAWLRDTPSTTSGTSESDNRDAAEPHGVADAEAEAAFWESRDLKAWKRHHCHICNRTLDGKHEWAVHLRSRRHQKQKAFLTRPLHPKDRRNNDPEFQAMLKRAREQAKLEDPQQTP